MRRFGLLLFLLLPLTLAYGQSFIYGPTNAPDPFNYGAGAVPAATRINLRTTIATDARIEIYDKVPNNTSLITRFYSDKLNNATFSTLWQGTSDTGRELTNGTYTAKVRLKLNLSLQLTIQGSGITFDSPSDTALDGAGNVYIINRDNRTVQKFNSGGILLLFDFQTICASNHPQGIAVDSGGNIYVANNYYNTIEKYDSMGNMINSNWATAITNPMGLFSDPSNVYAASIGRGLGSDVSERIYKIPLATGGRGITACTPAAPNNDFYDTMDVTRDPAGNYYLIGRGFSGRFYLFRHTAAGVYSAKAQLATGALDPGYLAGISMDSRTNLFVISSGNSATRADCWLGKYNPATLAQLATFGTYGSGNNELADSLGVGAYYDPSLGKTFVYVADAGNNRIQKIAVSNNAFTYVSTIEEDDDNVLAPNDVAVDSAGNVYVTSEQINTVKVFNSSGVYQYRIASYGTTAGLVNEPQGVVVDAAGRVYLSDSGRRDNRGRVQIFSNQGTYLRDLIASGNNQFFSGMGRDVNGNIFVGNPNTGAVYRNGLTTWCDVGGSAEDVCFDYKTNAYVSSALDGRIYRRNSAGTAVANVATTATPHIGIAVDLFGDVYCATAAGIERYNNSLSRRLGIYLSADLPNPQGIAFSPDYQYLWVADKTGNFLKKYKLEWSDERTDPMTIQLTNTPPTINNVALSGSPVRTYSGVTYARKGLVTFTITFSENMRTQSNLAVKYLVNGHEYFVSKTSFIGNTWSGTCTVASNDDGTATLNIRNGYDSVGNLMNPNPNASFGFVIDTTPPAPPTVNQPGSPTSVTPIQVNGSAEQNIFVHVYNSTFSSGGTVYSSQSNLVVDGSGNWTANSIALRPTTLPSSNWIWAVAVDLSGNVSQPSSPRKLVILADPSAGSGFISPTSNVYLGQTLGKPWTIHYIINSYMSNGTMTVDIPAGWAIPTTNSTAAGYVRIRSYTTTMTLATVPLACTNNTLKFSFKRAIPGGEVLIDYGKTGLLAVSNFAVIGINTFGMRAENNDPDHDWFPNDSVVPMSVGQSLNVNVLGESLHVGFGSAMPSIIYRGQSLVTVMTLFLRNPNGGVNHDEVTVLNLRTEDSNNAAINASTALSRLRITDGTNLYKDITTIPASSLLSIDLTGFPVMVPAGAVKTLFVILDIANSATARSLKIDLNSSADVTARDQASQTSIGVVTNAPDLFPMRTSRGLIATNSRAFRIYTSLLTGYSGWAEANFGYRTAARLVFSATDVSVNEVKITELSLVFRDGAGNSLVPSSWLRGVRVQRIGGGTTYLQDTTMEASGESVWLDLAANPVLLPNRTSVTLELKVSLQSNINVTNFRIHLLATNSVVAQDKLLSTAVSVKAATGYSFPMSDGLIPVVRRFRIEHDRSALESIWEPVTLRIFDANGRAVTNFSGTVTLSASGIVTEFSWTNMYGANGSIVDGGAGSARAVYAFSSLDKGVASVGFKSPLAGTAVLRMADSALQSISNNLVISPGTPPNIILKKLAFVTNSSSFRSKGGGVNLAVPGSCITYTISYSNSSTSKASNLAIRDRIPIQARYLSNSIYLNGILQTDASDGLDRTDFSATLTNTVYSVIPSVPAGGKGLLSYKVIIR